jgi:DNA-binding MarR family transcriptional regulator
MGDIAPSGHAASRPLPGSDQAPGSNGSRRSHGLSGAHRPRRSHGASDVHRPRRPHGSSSSHSPSASPGLARRSELPCAGEAAERYYREHAEAIELCQEFRRTARIVLAACDRFLAAFRLSDVAMTVLLELRRAPSGEPAALADRAGVRPTTLALLLRRLEREGWIERITHPHDARRRPVRLTPQGQARLDPLLRDYYQLTTAQLAPLTAADRATLRRLLEHIRTASPPPPRRSWAELGYDLEEPWEEWERRAERGTERRGVR